MAVRPLPRWCVLPLALLAGGTAWAAIGATAWAAAPSLVVDAETGRVLHAERATDPWYPASITKLMTAYVALQEVRTGRASMDQLLTVSEYAASQPPSKMAFRPGTEITLENALKIIMVKSANDVSVTIAEGLGGSVEGFADKMNAAAQSLGMRESRWANPHGLPDDRQQTSARDMAVLARAILRDFPGHRDLFNIGAIQYGRRVMNNHNGLIGRYEGADGMKTGFICASGFNVVATATRGGRRLITVVLGSPSARERTFKAADLFDRGFSTLPVVSFASSRVEELQPSGVATAPNMRPIICGGGRSVQEDDAQPAAVPETPSLTVSQDGNAENGGVAGSPALAFAAVGQPGRRTLGPRAALTPVPVWTGRTPGAVAEQDETAPARTARRRGRARVTTVQVKPLPLKPLPALKQPAAIMAGIGTPTVQAGGDGAKPAAKAKPAGVKPAAGAKPAASVKPDAARRTAEVKRKAKPKPGE